MSEIVYNGWHKVEKIDSLIKGNPVTREKLHIKSAVSAIVIDNVGKVALVKQYRPCVEQYLYELPAGCIDKDKSPEDILIEELQEECNLPKDKLSVPQLVREYYMICGSSDATSSIFVVEYDGIGVSTIVEDSDVESVEWFDINQLLQISIKDTKTLIAIQYIIIELLSNNKNEGAR
jgi:ADP-ribose pyrophosphatase